MKILIRKDNQSKWELVDDAGYAVETELQKLLAESPSLTFEEVREGASPLAWLYASLICQTLATLMNIKRAGKIRFSCLYAHYSYFDR